MKLYNIDDSILINLDKMSYIQVVDTNMVPDYKGKDRLISLVVLIKGMQRPIVLKQVEIPNDNILVKKPYSELKGNKIVAPIFDELSKLEKLLG